MEAEETNSAVEAEDTEGTSGSTTPDTQLRDNIYDTYLNLNMNAINKVTVKHMVGTPPGGGEPRDYFLVYLNLKEGALLGSKKNPITAQTNGYYEARDFYRSTSLRAGSPDQSITLHWNPLIQTNENGEAVVSFKGPGAKAQLRLEIQGVSSKGNPVATEQTIEVK